jgi:hypothetical protein
MSIHTVRMEQRGVKFHFERRQWVIGWLVMIEIDVSDSQ